MSDLDSILDLNGADIKEPRKAPPGNYVAEVRNFKFDKIPNEDETPYGNLEIVLIEPLDGQDLTNVNLARPLEWRGWLTEDGLGVTKTVFRRLHGDAVDSTSVRSWYENAVGHRIVAKVIMDPYQKKNRNREVPVVQDFKVA